MSKIIFRKISSITPVVTYLTEIINEHLQKNEKVLWLLSGGSAIKIEVEVAKSLEKNNINLNNLIVSLVDERYGPVGHKDSNWQQLLDAGFNLEGSQLQPVLSGKSFRQTISDYRRLLSGALKSSDFKLALIGVGADGHALGIKPNSPAAKSKQLICGYEWDDYIRLTPAPRLITMLDEAVAYMVGQEKHKLIDDLDKPIPASKFPGKYLLQARKLTIYNDYKDS